VGFLLEEHEGLCITHILPAIADIVYALVKTEYACYCHITEMCGRIRTQTPASKQQKDNFCYAASNDTHTIES
jgi:hypothetical protein